MKTLVSLATITAVMAFAAPAMAEISGSLGYTSIDTDRAQVSGITARATWTQAWYGAEAELSAGTGDDTVRVGSSSVKVKLNREESLFARAQWPVAPNFDVFVRAGYTNTHFGNSGLPVRRNGSNQAFSYGLGAEYFFDGSNGVRADWTQRDYKAIETSDSWSISYVHKF
ncbi:MAG TPA: porin family protein [Caulobacteraceae bacterium]|nr:porin family protein [Caulobacteraceae bacterium]